MTTLAQRATFMARLHVHSEDLALHRRRREEGNTEPLLHSDPLWNSFGPREHDAEVLLQEIAHWERMKEERE